ncbi:hypothetical protein C0992_011506 [Termitomyces sp. T32_za158]|nr:hypothetical protein C0992_011506 [Termitomyces sp. T32_za158]
MEATSPSGVSQGRNNSRIIRKLDFVVFVGREQTLEERDGRIKDNGTLNAALDACFDLTVVDEVGAC